MKLHITERALEDVPVPAKGRKLLVFDTEQGGFAVHVTPSGTKSYVIIYRDIDGRQRQERIATFGDIAAHSARELAKARLESIGKAKATEGHKTTVTASSAKSLGMTMDGYFYKHYLPAVQVANRAPETHLSLYRNHVGPYFGARRLVDITEACLLAFHSFLRTKPVAGGRWKTQQGKTLADGTVKRILILVRHLFNQAIEAKVPGLKENPTRMLKLTSKREVKGYFLNRTELTRLIQAAKDLGEVQMFDIIRVIAATGLRRANVLKMEWAWFDAERGMLSVPPIKDKGGKGFSIRLADSVVEYLVERKQQATGKYVFANPKTGNPYHSRFNAWNSIRKQAGLPTVRIHDLRHSFASLMLESGSDIVDVQAALGHTQLKTTAVYLHLRDGRKRERANAAVAAAGLF